MDSQNRSLKFSQTMVELHETLRDSDIWRAVAQLTEDGLRHYGWHYKVILRAMAKQEKNLEAPRYNIVQLVSLNDKVFEFAFKVNEVVPPGPHNSIEKFVGVQILQVIHEYITRADELNESAAADSTFFRG